MLVLDIIKRSTKTKSHAIGMYVYGAYNRTKISDEVVYGIVRCKHSLFIVINFFFARNPFDCKTTLERKQIKGDRVLRFYSVYIFQI